MPDAATQIKWDTEDKAFNDVLTRFATLQAKLEGEAAAASPDDLGKAQKKVLRHYESMVGRYKHYEGLFRARGEPEQLKKADELKVKLDTEMQPRVDNYKTQTEATRAK